MRKYWIFGLTLFVLFLALDVMTKAWTYSAIEHVGPQFMHYPYGGVGLFPDFFGIEGSLVHATNRGAAWGAFADFQWPLLLLRVLLVLSLVVYVIFFNQRGAYVPPLLLILSGAVGNIIDSFLYGKVVDMFKLVFWGYHYPIFNVADIAITVGVAWLILISLMPEKTDAHV